MEQFVRDSRINMTYEGTNTVQSLDLLGRKILGDNGAKLKKFGKKIAGVRRGRGHQRSHAGVHQPAGRHRRQGHQADHRDRHEGLRQPGRSGRRRGGLPARRGPPRPSPTSGPAWPSWRWRRRTAATRSTPPSWPRRASTSPSCCPRRRALIRTARAGLPTLDGNGRGLVLRTASRAPPRAGRPRSRPPLVPKKDRDTMKRAVRRRRPGPRLSANLRCAGLRAGSTATPVGLWKTIDDATKKERSYGPHQREPMVCSPARSRSSSDLARRRTLVCDKCTRRPQGQALAWGCQLIRGVKKNEGDRPRRWDGGDHPRPRQRQDLHGASPPIDGGKKLEVRGYRRHADAWPHADLDPRRIKRSMDAPTERAVQTTSYILGMPLEKP